MSSFSPRYLSAKKTVDDRALNPHVWNKFWELLPPSSRYRPLELLELGAGNGAMIERIRNSGRISAVDYTALDNNPDHIRALQEQAITLQAEQMYFTVRPEQADVNDFLSQTEDRLWDGMIAHAFLDLFHLPSILPRLFQLLPADGIFYFSMNFDGGTIFEPVIDAALDQQIERLYHASMDQMLADGPRGGSRTGRQLFHLIEAAGGKIEAAGSSDWVVYPQDGGYPADEAYFLEHMLFFFESSLTGHPDLDAQQFREWLATRRQQITEGQLVLIAHHLDVTGRKVN